MRSAVARIFVFFFFLAASFGTSLAPVAASNDTPDGTTCLTCHDAATLRGAVQHRPAAEKRCLTCHLPHVSRYAKLLSQPEPDLCLDCHQNFTAILQKKNVHQPVLDGACSRCHRPHAGNRQALLVAAPATLCRECHPMPAITGKQAHRPAIADCLVCHAPHASSNRALLRRTGDTLCLGCHDRDRMNARHPRSGPSPRHCLSCHQPHGSSQPHLLRPVLHPPFADGCDSCHQGTKPVATDICLNCHEDIADALGAVHTHLTAAVGENACSRCHDPHTGNTKKLLRDTEFFVCTGCHTDVPDRYRGAYSHPLNKASCSDCHEPHGSNRLAMLRGDGSAVCSQCHETQGTFTHPVGETTRDPRTGQPVTCLTCHDPKGSDFPYQLLADPTRDLCVGCHHY